MTQTLSVSAEETFKWLGNSQVGTSTYLYLHEPLQLTLEKKLYCQTRQFICEHYSSWDLTCQRIENISGRPMSGCHSHTIIIFSSSPLFCVIFQVQTRHAPYRWRKESHNTLACDTEETFPIELWHKDRQFVDLSVCVLLLDCKSPPFALIFFPSLFVLRRDLIASYIMRPICSVSSNFKLIKSRWNGVRKKN